MAANTSRHYGSGASMSDVEIANLGAVIKKIEHALAANIGELDPAATNATNNFEYDDNEWDIGIGDLIIDLDADIEKTRDEKLSSGTGMASTPASAASAPNNANHHQLQNSASGLNSNSSSSSQASGVNVSGVNAVHANAGNPGKMAVEHSATVDKGLKMKIKRTKPGTKTSEAKHEIVKSNEINGTVSSQDSNNGTAASSTSSSSAVGSTSASAAVTQNSQNSECGAAGGGQSSSSNKSKPSHSPASAGGTGAAPSSTAGSKRGSSGHRRDKARDKHEKPQSNHTPQQTKPEMNGTARPTPQGQNSAGGATQSQGPTPAATAPQQTQGPPPSSRTGFSVSQGPGPPATSAAAPCPPPSPASATAAGAAAKPEQTKVAAVPGPPLTTPAEEAMDTAASPPPAKKMKTEPKCRSYHDLAEVWSYNPAPFAPQETPVILHPGITASKHLRRLVTAECDGPCGKRDPHPVCITKCSNGA
ncbi:Zinc finger protein 609 [Acromyrmex echinatior]|uniref:Zinc finger protein 609 n=1 Tax=Acromyrmex echinatior TaxID=103372 RepID=F4WG84_ACREC|nr:Zinc finger protein 609 [Acromyrmex echinatior]